MNATRHPGRRLLAVGLFIALLLAVSELAGLRENFSLAFLQQQILAHPAGGLLAFVLLFAVGNLIQIPGWLFLAAAVLTLGQFWGGLATYVAASLACVASFLLLRLLGGDALRQLPGALAARIFRQLDAHPVGSVALLRLLFQTLPALNAALALSGLRFRHYLAGTLLGLPLPIALYCLLFDSLAHLLT
ncbi:MAG: DedA family protein [Betaproteobacteria bacterium HGW-Betaproteobacteria-12]|nr:MAG: DedA family protein [Betaproteobacteria bacterium HGW-Betaproteobacteria-12]